MENNSKINIPNMMDLSLKFINEWEVLTPSGFQEFKGVKKITKNKIITIKYIDENNKEDSIICSEKHEIKINNGIFLPAKNILITDILDGNKYIISIETSDVKTDLYDLIEVSNGYEYYSNGLIHHNCAFVKNVEEVWASAQSTLSTGGKAIILSTPNGQGGFFHGTWMNALDDINGFNPIKLDWKVHPDRDQKWRDEQTAKLGEKMASQECDASFLTSGNTLVGGELLTWYEENTILEPIRKMYQDKLWQYKEFESTKKYLIPVDVSRGDGSDFSAFHIIDIETLEQVADFKAKVSVKELVEILIEVGLSWNSAIISVENASMGWGVIQDLIEKEYPNLYYSPKRDVIDEYEYLDESQFTPGFTNSMKTRPLIIAKLEEVINNKMLILRSQRTINELKVFIWLNHKAQAQQGYNDDLILALAQGCYLRETALRQSYANRFLDAASGVDFYTDVVPAFNSRDKSRRKSQTYSKNNKSMGIF